MGLCSSPESKNTDYHTEMNTDSFKDWFVNKFLNYLEEGSIVVMDNASYHSKLLDKIPPQVCVEVLQECNITL